MLRDEGGTAFPSASESSTGMSLRDYFAGQALGKVPFVYDSDPGQAFNTNAKWPEHIAKRCYEVADAMLEARKGGGC